MQGVILKLDETGIYLTVIITPDLVDKKLDVQAIYGLLKNSEFSQFFILEENIIDLIASYNTAKKNNNMSVISAHIAEKKDNKIECIIPEDKLSVTIKITCGYGDAPPKPALLKRLLADNGIKRGISIKRLRALIRECATAKPGESLQSLVAKGLPPRKGKPSQFVPLVPNALERLLAPQETGGKRVDMRDLGAIISVKKGAEILRRTPPTDGRDGYFVTGEVIKATPGDWVNFRMGDGTVMSDHDENLLIADISGMPKFKEQKMWVDDIYTCKGVNVGTGNVNYDGSVLVNGDVTEKMEIVATGDVTINGFIESATIKAGGDIMITEGAMGKVNDAATEYSSKLIAKGNIYAQHGQGLDIHCQGNVNIGRQIAHSKIYCKGKVTVGAADLPKGNIFSCNISCQGTVTAGTFGAVSGSSLNIDFSEGFERLLERNATLEDLLEQLKQNNGRHKERMNIINSKVIPVDMQQRVEDANQLFQNETQLLYWLESKAAEISKAKSHYQTNIQITANKRVYPGVTLQFNNKTWRADKELDPSQISFKGHKWQVKSVS
ncbi:DUF342 domain-containing protein [Paraglaciecola sp. 2405UD69-4]|uniref:DUF342 domain-containing protein n=1 Tax=Paraglaciecola sp. 2405UD69-4 TaxID=3391836 RepID=UPI0039C8CB8F